VVEQIHWHLPCNLHYGFVLPHCTILHCCLPYLFYPLSITENLLIVLKLTARTFWYGSNRHKVNRADLFRLTRNIKTCRINYFHSTTLSNRFTSVLNSLSLILSQSWNLLFQYLINASKSFRAIELRANTSSESDVARSLSHIGIHFTQTVWKYQNVLVLWNWTNEFQCKARLSGCFQSSKISVVFIFSCPS
jgi:hypothetical protein